MTRDVSVRQDIFLIAADPWAFGLNHYVAAGVGTALVLAVGLYRRINEGLTEAIGRAIFK